MDKIYPVSGHSMRFLLEPGDRVAVTHIRREALKTGDIALLLKWNGAKPEGYVIHRVAARFAGEGGPRLLTKGDSLLSFDGPSSSFQPVGKVEEIFKRGLRARPGDLVCERFWPFFSLYSFLANKFLSFSLIAGRYFFVFLHLFLVRPFPFRRTTSAAYNAAVCWWESCLYPSMLKTCSRLFFVFDSRAFSAAPPYPDVRRFRSGRIERDEIWAGEVTVRDYLIIDRNVRVTVLPGASIRFERAEGWFIPVLRSGLDGLEELDSLHPKILVYGSFDITGSREAPVTFSENSGGIHYLGGASGTLSHFHFPTSGGTALSAWDSAVLKISNSSFAAPSAALRLNNCSTAEISSCSISDAGTSAFVLRDHARLRASDIRVKSSAAAALDAGGRSVSEIKDASFTGASPALRLNSFSTAEISSCSVSGAGTSAFILRERARLRASDLRVRSSAAAALDAGGRSGIEINDSDIRGNGTGIRLSGRASAALKNCVFSRNGSGVSLDNSSTLSASDCTFEDNRGPSVETLDKAEALLSEVRSSGRPSAIVLKDGAGLRILGGFFQSQASPLAYIGRGSDLLADNSSFSSEGNTFVSEDASSLKIRGSRIASSGGYPLRMSCGRFEMSGCEVSGQGGVFIEKASSAAITDSVITSARYALISGAGRLHVSGLRAEGGEMGGIELRAGENYIERTEINNAPSPGISAFPGAEVKSLSVLYNGRAWVPAPPREYNNRSWAAPRSGGPPASLKKCAHTFVIATSGLFPLVVFYRLVYKAALFIASRTLYIQPPVEAVCVHRGMTTASWLPGYSDIDLQLIIAELPAEKESAFMDEFFNRRSVLKSFFPFLGETLISTAGELKAFLDLGGVKAGEFSASAKSLRGKTRPGAPPYVRPAVSSADIAEAFYSYTLLMKNLFGTKFTPEAMRKRNCFKAIVDIQRYLDPFSSPALRLSRAAYACSRKLEPFEEADCAKGAFVAFSSMHRFFTDGPDFKAAQVPEGTKILRAGPGAAFGSFNKTRFDDVVGEIRHSAPGGGISCILDSLYRFYVVVPDENAQDPDAFSNVCATISRLRLKNAFLAPVPMVLSRSTFEALSVSAYLNNPLFWLDFHGYFSGDFSADGLLPEESVIYKYNFPPLSFFPSVERLRETAMLSFRHFAVSCRSYFPELTSQYLYSRIMGLRLLIEKETAVPFSDTAFIRKCFLRQYPAYAAELERPELLRVRDLRRDYAFILGQVKSLESFLDERDSG